MRSATIFWLAATLVLPVARAQDIADAPPAPPAETEAVDTPLSPREIARKFKLDWPVKSPSMTLAQVKATADKLSATLIEKKFPQSGAADIAKQVRDEFGPFKVGDEISITVEPARGVQRTHKGKLHEVRPSRIRVGARWHALDALVDKDQVRFDEQTALQNVEHNIQVQTELLERKREAYAEKIRKVVSDRIHARAGYVEYAGEWMAAKDLIDRFIAAAEKKAAARLAQAAEEPRVAAAAGPREPPPIAAAPVVPTHPLPEDEAGGVSPIVLCLLLGGCVIGVLAFLHHRRKRQQALALAADIEAGTLKLADSAITTLGRMEEQIDTPLTAPERDAMMQSLASFETTFKIGTVPEAMVQQGLGRIGMLRKRLAEVKVRIPFKAERAPPPAASTAAAAGSGQSTAAASDSSPGHDTPITALRNLADDVLSLADTAFESPGPMFNEMRKGMLASWIVNLAKNLQRAAGTLEGRGVPAGSAIYPEKVAESLEQTCAQYSKGLGRMEGICGPEVRARFETILEQADSVARDLGTA